MATKEEQIMLNQLGVLAGVDRGIHGGLGNLVVWDPRSRSMMVVRGDCVAVVAGL